MILISDKDEEMVSLLHGLCSSWADQCVRVTHAREIVPTLSQHQSSQHQSRETADQKSFQLWITDAILPEISVPTLVQEVRGKFPQVKILVLVSESQFSEWQPTIQAANHAGKVFLLKKPFQRQDFTSVLQSILPNGPLRGAKSEPEIQCETLVLKTKSQDVFLSGIRIDLTPNEYKLLLALLQSELEKPGQILNRSQLILQVQGEGVAVVDRAVDTHVASLRKKLGTFGMRIETARGEGYRLQGPVSRSNPLS